MNNLLFSALLYGFIFGFNQFAFSTTNYPEQKCTSNNVARVLRWGEKAFVNLLELVNKSPKPARPYINTRTAEEAANFLSHELGIKIENFKKSKSGGMNHAFFLEEGTNETFPASSKIPAELHGKSIDEYIIKIQQKYLPDNLIERDEIAKLELTELTKNGPIHFVETYIKTMTDGTRVIFQKKAKGENVYDIVAKNFGQSIREYPLRNDGKNLVMALLSPKTKDCFRPTLTVLFLSKACQELQLNTDINIEKVKKMLETPKGKSLMDILLKLKNFAEDTQFKFKKTRTANKKAPISNNLFWMDHPTTITTLDLSSQNFFLDFNGQNFEAYIFDY